MVDSSAENLNIPNNIHGDLRSVQTIPSDSRRRRHSRIAGFVVKSFVCLLIIGAPVGVLMYLLRMKSTSNFSNGNGTFSNTTQGMIISISTYGRRVEKTSFELTVNIKTGSVRIDETTQATIAIITAKVDETASDSRENVAVATSPHSTFGLETSIPDVIGKATQHGIATTNAKVVEIHKTSENPITSTNFMYILSSTNAEFNDALGTTAAETMPPSDICVDRNPCKNNGICELLAANNYTCKCAIPYYGINCEFVGRTEENQMINAIFGRNNWNDALVVIDVTGSMRACAQAVVDWITNPHLSTNIKTFIFFNDGDNKTDASKIIGNTGGIYATNSTNSSVVLGVLNYSRSQGHGGDAEENDIEAIMYGVGICSNCKNIVHIADNQVTPRDMILLSNLINKQIKVIPCEVSRNINTALLNIALLTNGSLHTAIQDVNYLSNVPINGAVTINSYNYRRTSTGFVSI